MNTVSTSPRIRHQLLVQGIVQGVGFRPFIFGLAAANNLTGFVGNSSGGVFIEVEGETDAVTTFHHALTTAPPPLARIEYISTTPLPLKKEEAFLIVRSEKFTTETTLISPDISICEECLSEMFSDPNPRYRYPFINCTNCGPRFSIIQALPYDRPFTTMSDFGMCADCRLEYENPADRRFHAQPIACQSCGPKIWLVCDSQQYEGESGLQMTQQMLADGKIVAIKGVGGFHLVCDAKNHDAVATLRQRKGRVAKPFAVMARDCGRVQQIAHLSAEEAQLLTSKERPILLLQKKQGSPLSDLIAPQSDTVGIMLPYAPLHYLLFEKELQTAVLLMTSANHSNHPIIIDNQTAQEQLTDLADALLLHNRPIENRCDDSVVRLIAHENAAPTRQFIRRARGFVPKPIQLPYELPSLLAVGGELKAAFCLAQGSNGFLSPHIGDLENLETLKAFETAVSRYKTLFRTEPELLAYDMHPNYLSRHWAQQSPLPGVAVQHHHAHIAAVMAEHQLSGDTPVIGFSFDGSGYGLDGAIWGGELLIADYGSFERVAHLKYVPLAGGDASIKRPYRLALTYLREAGLPFDENLPCVQACPDVEKNILQTQLDNQLNTVPTSSIGRLFDALASLTGVCQHVTYEGQAAIAFEAVAAKGVADHYSFAHSDTMFDPTPLIQEVVKDLQAGVAVPVMAAKFHNALTELILGMSLKMRQQTGLNYIALSGGVFQNVRLISKTVALLRAQNFNVLTHQRVPPNDGGLALGQAMIAGTKQRR